MEETQTAIGQQEELKFYKKRFDKIPSDRRERILETAIEEFAVKGFSAAGINEIARKADISIGALYSYFASKEDLFLTVVDKACVLMKAILEDLDQSSETLEELIRNMLTASRHFAHEYAQLNQIYLDLTTQALSGLSVRLSDRVESITPSLLSGRIRQEQALGRLNPSLNPEAAAYCIDNIFVMYQFSFSSDYYRERMRLFLGRNGMEQLDLTEKQILDFIYAAVLK